MSVENNLELVQTLDDAWNNQDWETFEKRHAADTAVYWPGRPDPTSGRDDHRAESIEFFKTFPDNHIDNRPYKSADRPGGLDMFCRAVYRHDEGADERA
jgi:hypothetical protein